MKKRTLGAVLSILFIMPWGCNTDDCRELGAAQNYHITDMSIANVRLIEDGYSVEENIAAQTEIAYNRYGLKLMPVTEIATQLSRHLSAGFFPAAYACSPISPQPTEEIADIAVFSNADYAQANSAKVIAAGDTLNAVFNTYDSYSGRIVGLPDFLVDEHLKASDEGLILQPSAMPAAAQTHAFTVHYRLNNGEFYSITAQAITLIP